MTNFLNCVNHNALKIYPEFNLCRR